MLDFLKRLFGFGPKAPDDLPGRNDLCWCGSGKKYKHCHWAHDHKC